VAAARQIIQLIREVTVVAAGVEVNDELAGREAEDGRGGGQRHASLGNGER
jgi:hypothetical protein